MKSEMIVELDLRRCTMEEAMDGWSFIEFFASTPGRDTHSIFGPDNADKAGRVFSGESTVSERLPYHLSR
jgi:hypothetical protein